jgi:hypothetical protein
MFSSEVKCHQRFMREILGKGRRSEYSKAKDNGKSLNLLLCRAPCHDDRCLMMTNKHAFPDVRLFLYNPAVNISESERIHDEYYNSDYFIAHPYSHAVDGNDNTAWRTLNSMYEPLALVKLC